MRKVRVVVLCEDRAHWHFIRAYLTQRGWSSRHITSRISPAAQGSAEQWVREQFAQELQTYRSKARENVCLIIMIDGDRSTPEQRIKSLNLAAQAAGVQERGLDERVAIFVPSRNLESWFAWLDGKPVDESTDYKAHYRIGASRGDYGKQMAERCVQGRGFELAPASVQMACTEWARIRP